MLIHKSVFISLYKLWQTQNMNSAQEQEILRKSGGMVESKESRPPEGNESKIPTDGNKGRPPSPRSTEVRNLEINQARSPKPRLTSRAGALTWKAIILTLDQEHKINSPEQ